MATAVPTTELDAVNQMLAAVGTTPVNTLSVSGLTDAAIALDTLRFTSKEVQSRGWWFNQDKAVQYIPASGEIVVPDAVLSIRPTYGTYTQAPETTRFVQRDGVLWNLDTKAKVTISIYADIIREIEFENLPESVRRAVYVRAARVFQTQVLGDDQLGVFSEAHEAEAWVALEGDEALNNPETSLFLRRVRAVASSMIPDPVQSARGQQQARSR